MCINYIILHKKVKMISVIVPVYRVEKYLKRCVDSILQQTYENIEIILVDDGSPDQSGKICDDIARIDSRVRVIHKKNGGLSSARNAALEIINGDYVSFVDSDDLIHPQMIELLLNKMLENNSDVVCTGLRNFSSTNVVFNNIDEIECEVLQQCDFINHLYPENFGKISVTSCGKIFKRSVFENIRFPEGVIYEDLSIYIDILLKCQKILVTNKELYYYYYNPDSIMRSDYLAHSRFGEFAIREKYIEFFRDRGLYDQAELAMNDYLTFFMRNFFAVKLRYTEKKDEFKLHLKVFKRYLPQILSNKCICRMRKICALCMLIMPNIAYWLTKRYIPDCLIEEMRER